MSPKLAATNKPSAYEQFTREQWQYFRQDMPLTLTTEDLERLQGVNEVVSISEVEQIYLPLSRLLSFYVTATQQLHAASSRFLGSPEPKVPFIIGVAGSVAVGKSTTSRILQALLSRWPDHPNVAIVTTDGFLYSNAQLARVGLEDRKGFPESYDVASLLQLMHDIKAGKGQLHAPVYSHHSYDIMPDERVVIDHPDIVIVEGLNVLQTGPLKPDQKSRVFVSDYFDFSIFVDANIDVIKDWFIQRVLFFCDTAFQKPGAFFHFLTELNYEERLKFAERVWREINQVNLLENILPYRDRARLLLHKTLDHSIDKVFLRKL